MAVDTKVLEIDPHRVEADKIKKIAGVLQGGGIMAFPTDTVYGLGANCFAKSAIQRIFRLKGRKSSKPLSVLISDKSMIMSLADEIPSLFWVLTEKFWPGPLTLVLKASSELPKEMVGPGESVGIRLPDILWLQRLIDNVAFPITATSANISGEDEIDDPHRIKDIFCGKIDLIVDGGKTGGILPSTVVDLSSPKPKILREGAVPLSDFEKYLKGDSKF
jgi:L-threonylcarbamoyladenylate synthase